MFQCDSCKKKSLWKKGDSLRNYWNCDHCNHTPPLISNLCLWIANLHTWNRQATKDVGNIDFFFSHRARLDFCYLKKKSYLFCFLALCFFNIPTVCLCFARRKTYMIRSQTHFVHIKLYFFICIDNLTKILGLIAWTPQGLPGTHHIWIWVLSSFSYTGQTSSLTDLTLK